MENLSISLPEPPYESGVYCIRNRYTKNVYVGSAHNLRVRWNLHKTNLRANRHHSKILQHAWNKYGPEAFEFFVLAYCEKSRVLEVEQYWLSNMTAQYNVCRIAGSRAGAKNSKEHNKAISEKAKQRWSDPEFKAQVTAKLRAVAHRGANPKQATRFITAFGKTQSLQDWERETGIKRETIAYRLNVGKHPEIALGQKKLKRGPACQA